MLILRAIMILRQIFEVKYESVKNILSSALVVAYSAKQAGQSELIFSGKSEQICSLFVHQLGEIAGI